MNPRDNIRRVIFQRARDTIRDGCKRLADTFDSLDSEALEVFLSGIFRVTRDANVIAYRELGEVLVLMRVGFIDILV